jgi:hypothetical protein
MRVYEIWQEVRGSHSLQVNDVMNVIVELGLTTYAHLSPQMRHALFSRRSAKDDLKLQAVLNPRITRIASSLRADDRLNLRIPRHLKELIREEARRADVTMSEDTRRRITAKEAA